MLARQFDGEIHFVRSFTDANDFEHADRRLTLEGTAPGGASAADASPPGVLAPSLSLDLRSQVLNQLRSGVGADDARGHGVVATAASTTPALRQARAGRKLETRHPVAGA